MYSTQNPISWFPRKKPVLRPFFVRNIYQFGRKQNQTKPSYLKLHGNVITYFLVLLFVPMLYSPRTTKAWETLDQNDVLKDLSISPE